MLHLNFMETTSPYWRSSDLNFPPQKLNSFLLVSCHTAELTEDSIADEGLDFAAAMQYCGFRSVIRTMWATAWPTRIRKEQTCLDTSTKRSFREQPLRMERRITKDLQGHISSP